MIRVILIALAFLALTLVLLPLQLIGIAFDLRLQRTIPHLYHRILCALIGVRIREVGARSRASPALILSNHVSWLDICVISALTPVVFVAKSEVAGWPVFGWLARLQRTIFINRQARHKTGGPTREHPGGRSGVAFACCRSARRWSARCITRSATAPITPKLPCSRCRWLMSGSAACRWAEAYASAGRGTAPPT